MAYQQQSQQQQLHHLGHQIQGGQHLGGVPGVPGVPGVAGVAGVAGVGGVGIGSGVANPVTAPIPSLLNHFGHNQISQSLHHTPQSTPQPTAQVPQAVRGKQPRQTKKQKELQQKQQQHQQQQQQQQQQPQNVMDAHALAQQHHMEMLARASQNELMETSTRKVAPRSSDLFRVGPPFGMMEQHQPVYLKSNDMPVLPMLHARIDRGFEMGETGTWIGYKRNYFTLVASFNFQNLDFNRFLENRFYTYDTSNKNGMNGNGSKLPNHTSSSSSSSSSSSMNQPQNHPHHPHHQQHAGQTRLDISYFAIRLVAKCSDDDVAISLIQHTAKRDKGPQFPPPIYPALPGDLPDHDTVRASCNKRNGGKIEHMNKIFFFDRAQYYNDYNLNQTNDSSILRNYPSDSISKVARFERIQFTSSIRVKSTLTSARYFTLSCELLGIVEDEELQIQPILLGSVESPPLVIRGRSPSSYHKDRTSGYRPPTSASPAGHQ